MTWFRYRAHCFCCVNQVVPMGKSREARSPPALLSFKGQVTEHMTTVTSKIMVFKFVSIDFGNGFIFSFSKQSVVVTCSALRASHMFATSMALVLSRPPRSTMMMLPKC